MANDKEKPTTIDGLTIEDLQEMLQAKSREIAELNEELTKQAKENTRTENRAMKVYAENERLKAAIAAPEDLQAEIARMDYHLALAKQFTAAGAFPKMTPEQAFTIMRAGEEMGMKPMESLNGLYIVNGTIGPHGKAMPARIKKFGYNIAYISEDKEHCTVRVWKEDAAGEVTEEYRETAEANDPILASHSKFMKISPKDKMRYHALRKIINFHLPHIYSSISDLFAPAVKNIEAEEPKSMEGLKQQQRRKRVEAAIEKAESLDELQTVQRFVGQLQLAEEYESKHYELMEQLSDQENPAHDEEQ